VHDSSSSQNAHGQLVQPRPIVNSVQLPLEQISSALHPSSQSPQWIGSSSVDATQSSSSRPHRRPSQVMPHAEALQ
jgi:hypothetical protein